MPWEKGFVPPDGFRHYFHGRYWRMEFEPCGHKLEDYHEEGIQHSDQIAFYYMEKTRQKILRNHERIQKTRTFPHERNLIAGIVCPTCDEPITEIRQEIKNDYSEMPERQYKASKIMGWV